MYVDYGANTVRVVHSADIIKFGDLATNKNTFSLTNWPGIDIRYYHSILLKIILVVTLVWRFKKLPNHQIKITKKCTTYMACFAGVFIILLYNAHVHLYCVCACVCVCVCVQASINKTLQWPSNTLVFTQQSTPQNTVGDRTINSKEGCTSHMM